MKISSTSLPGGNQVDGLSPASSVSQLIGDLTSVIWIMWEFCTNRGRSDQVPKWEKYHIWVLTKPQGQVIEFWLSKVETNGWLRVIFSRKIHSTVKFLMISDFDIRNTLGFFRKYFSALRFSNLDYRDLRLKSQIRVELGWHFGRENSFYSKIASKSAVPW